VPKLVKETEIAMSASNAWTVTEPQIMEMPRTLDQDTSPDALGDARLCIKSGARELILDCDATETLTAAGMRAMLVLASEMKKVQGKLAVCNLQGQPREMFEACGFSSIIPSFASKSEAVARLAA
jgi:anti-anti-sigma factor